MLHLGSVVRVQSKEYYSMFIYIFFYIFLLFFIEKKCGLLFFDDVSNFCNRILSNQKLELVIRNCQWDRIYTQMV